MIEREREADRQAGGVIQREIEKRREEGGGSLHSQSDLHVS